MEWNAFNFAIFLNLLINANMKYQVLHFLYPRNIPPGNKKIIKNEYNAKIITKIAENTNNFLP